MPNNLKAPRLSPDPALLCLLVVAVLINLPGLLGYILPVHDTMYVFQAFYFFYNDFFISGDIPRWLPFGLYGVQSDTYLTVALSPSGYFVGLVGYLAGVKDALFLFHLSLVLEEVIFLTGAYLLARSLFRRRGTAFVVSLAALCGSVLTVQIWLNFRIYSLLPLVIYLLLRAFSTHSYRYFAMSAIVFTVSFFGSLPYFTAISLLIIFMVLAALFISNIKDLRPFLRPRSRDLAASALLFSIFLIVTALYYHFVENAMNHTEGLYIGRDPETLKTDLNTFLTYAEELINLEKFKGLVWPGPGFVAGDLTLHVGFITLLFALIGAMTSRNALSIAFVALAIVFGLLSLGARTPLAEFLYAYFPMMDYYRHIGHTVSNYKIFIPFLAGFGLERVLDLVDGGRRRGLALLAEALSALAVIAGSAVYAMASIPEKTALATISTAVLLAILFSLRYGFGVLKRPSHLLVAFFLFQMLSYQALVNATMYNISKRVLPFNKEVVSVYDYGYQGERAQETYDRRAQEAIPVIDVSWINYAFAYNFLYWDPCASVKRVDFINRNVIDYFRLKQADMVNINPRFVTYGKRLSLPDDPNFLSSIGCNSSKLKLFKNERVIFSGSTGESRDIIRNTAAIDRVLVLNGVEGRSRPLPAAADDYASGTVLVRDFSANRISLDVEVGEEDGAWLFYADAFHPGWKAYVNGGNVPLAQANIAFKAIPLRSGRSSVSFVFEHEPARTTGRLLIISGLIFVAAVLFIISKMCLSKPL